MTALAISNALSEHIAAVEELKRENAELRAANAELRAANAELRAALVSVLAWVSERDALWRLVETEIAVRWPEAPS